MPQKQKKYSSINSSLRLFHLLPYKMKILLWLLLAGMIFKAIIETATMGLIAFFAASISRPDEIVNSSYVLFAKNNLGLTFFSTVPGFVVGLSIIIIILVALKNGFKSYIMMRLGRYSADLEAFLGKSLIEGFLKMPYKWHIDQNSADLVYAIEIRKQVGRYFITSILKLISDFLLVVIMIMGLLLVQPQVSLMVLLVLGGTGIIIYKSIRKKIDQIAGSCQHLEQKINRDSTKAIHGIKDVKIFAKEDIFIEKSHKHLKQFSNRYGWFKFFEASPSAIFETVGFMMLTGAVCLMMFGVNTSPVKITGTLALLSVAAWKCLPAMDRILRMITAIRYSLPFISKILFYLDDISSTIGSAEKTKGENFSFRKQICLDHVYFKYPKSEVSILDDINICFRKGQTIGIIGPSGSGKSTLVDLITGMLEPVKGKIFIDDLELNPEYAGEWRKQIGYVSQFPFIYDSSLAENVAFGIPSENIDREKVKKCCSMAYMDEFMIDMPKGIDTEIGERGIRLSGGQRQRVAIARALYNSPEIMIFDEATSSLDTKSEDEIKKTIYSLRAGKTLIIIAHRLTTVEDCDCIFWLEKGAIKNSGASEKIIPLYKKNFKRKQNE
jgi:ATP-binding cassette, subfamily B, bacterial PglK